MRLLRDTQIAIWMVLAPSHFAALRRLPDHHADPIDPILLAQASVERLVPVSADRLVWRYDVALLRA